MSEDARPIIIAFDGSPPAEAAVREAVALFRGRRLMVVSIWEPGLAMAVGTVADTSGVLYAAPSPDEVATVDRLQREHAASVAEAGAELARRLGATAEALPVRDRVDVAETIAALAERHDAAAIVTGSRGLGAAKSRLLGSTSRRLLHETHRPVLVVRTPQH
jgi:nucleotide-binding universal stress UspA family protein